MGEPMSTVGRVRREQRIGRTPTGEKKRTHLSQDEEKDGRVEQTRRVGHPGEAILRG